MKGRKYSFRIKEVNYQYLDNENNVENTKYYILVVRKKFLGIFPIWQEFVDDTVGYYSGPAQFERMGDTMKIAMEYVKTEEKKRLRKIKEKQLKTTAKVVSNFNLDGDGEVL